MLTTATVARPSIVIGTMTGQPKRKWTRKTEATSRRGLSALVDEPMTDREPEPTPVRVERYSDGSTEPSDPDVVSEPATGTPDTQKRPNQAPASAPNPDSVNSSSESASGDRSDPVLDSRTSDGDESCDKSEHIEPNHIEGIGNVQKLLESMELSNDRRQKQLVKAFTNVLREVMQHKLPLQPVGGNRKALLDKLLALPDFNGKGVLTFRQWLEKFELLASRAKFPRDEWVAQIKSKLDGDARNYILGCYGKETLNDISDSTDLDDFLSKLLESPFGARKTRAQAAANAMKIHLGEFPSLTSYLLRKDAAINQVEGGFGPDWMKIAAHLVGMPRDVRTKFATNPDPTSNGEWPSYPSFFNYAVAQARCYEMDVDDHHKSHGEREKHLPHTPLLLGETEATVAVSMTTSTKGPALMRTEWQSVRNFSKCSAKIVANWDIRPRGTTSAPSMCPPLSTKNCSTESPQKRSRLTSLVTRRKRQGTRGGLGW